MDDNKIQNNKENLKTVRTYMSDMADTVRANEISVIKVALAEQNKHAREDLYRKAEGTPVNKIFWVIGGMILIAGAVYGSSFLFKEKTKNSTFAPTPKTETIISYDETSNIILKDTDNIVEKINIAKKKKGDELNRSGMLKFIVLEKEMGQIKERVGVTELFSRLKFSGPSSLVRSLSDSYMIGTYRKNEENFSPKLFMVFQSKDYEFTYAGMLEWEKTMASDLYDLFEPKTTDTKSKIKERVWKDLIINNKDSRVLFNEDNKPILYYIFTDKNNLIIADNQETIKEIISKLILENMKPL